MPIDPSIPLQVQPPQNNLMQTLAQVYAMKNQQQQHQYQQQHLALQQQEEARLGAAAQLKAQEDARTRAAGQALAPHLQVGEGPAVKDFDIDAFIGGMPEDQQPAARAMAQKWFDTQSEIANRRATAKKTLADVQQEQVKMAGQYGRMIQSAGYDPQFSQGVLALWHKADPEFDPDQVWQTHGQQPEQWKRFVNSVVDAAGEDYTLRPGDTRATPSGGTRLQVPAATPKPELVESYDPATKITTKTYVNPTLGASFIQRPPQAEGGPVNYQVQKGIDPKTGQNVWLGFNPRTNKLEPVESPYQPEQNVSEEIPANWRSTFNLATGGLTKDKRENYERQINQALANTPPEARPAAFAQLVKRAAIDSENVSTKGDILSRAQTVAALSDVEKGLQELKAAGVPTGWFSGTAEELARKVGESRDPRLVRLGTRLSTMLSNYTRSMSGVQFSEEEAKRYKELFPNYKNTFVVNLAQIQGLRDDMASNDRVYWEQKLGPEGARLVGSPANAFTLSGTGQTAPAAGVEAVPEGTRKAIPGIPGGEAEMRGGKWIRTK